MSCHLRRKSECGLTDYIKGFQSTLKVSAIAASCIGKKHMLSIFLALFNILLNRNRHKLMFVIFEVQKLNKCEAKGSKPLKDISFRKCNSVCGQS